MGLVQQYLKALQLIDTPLKDTHLKDTPLKDTPLKDTPLKDTPLKDTPLKDTSRPSLMDKSYVQLLCTTPMYKRG